jgi:exopolysaccharide biosynthesis polyprenyl glycosylphosphotransferase
VAGNTAPLGLERQRLTPSNRVARVRTLLLILVTILDVVALTSAFLVGYASRATLPLFSIPDQLPDFIRYLPTMLLHVGTVITLFFISRLYHERRAVSRFDHARDILGAVTIGSVLTFGLQGLIFKNTTFDVEYPRAMFFYVWIFSALFSVTGREFYQSLRRRLREQGIDRDNLLIVGVGKIAREITGKIKARPALGYNIVGVVVNNTARAKGNLLGFPVLGAYQDLPMLIDAYGVGQVIIALPEPHRNDLVELITLCQRGRVDIKVYPDMFAYMAGDLNVDDLGGTPLITVRDIALRGWRLSLKRGLDIFGSVIGLVFLSPLFLLTALLVRLTSEGPVFLVQERMGLDGRPFPLIKFRTMQVDAEVNGPGWTVNHDPRVTPFGRWLRRTSWDEMPQLINVLVGHMSLVGPRPERPMYVRQFRERIPRYMERHREKAGMTGWAQVNGLRGDTSIAERTSYDLWYVENWSLWLDIKIIFRQILQIVLRRDKNAY